MISYGAVVKPFIIIIIIIILICIMTKAPGFSYDVGL